MKWVAAKYMCSAKHLKNKFDGWVTKLRKNLLQKNLFFHIFYNIQQNIFSKHLANILLEYSAKHQKVNFHSCVTKFHKNQLQKTLYKNFFYLFFRNFFATIFKQTLSKH